MKIELKDVLHLYIGAKATIKTELGEEDIYINSVVLACWNIKPHLRPLSSLTDSEKVELMKFTLNIDEKDKDSIKYIIIWATQDIAANKFTPSQFIYLTKDLHIDLFDLITTNQAIEP